MIEPSSPPAKARHGCYFYGCIAGIVCMVAILVAFLLGVHMFKKVLNEYTDTKPVPLPRSELTAAQVEELQHRIDAFQDAVSTGRPTPPLELTSQELNAIISTRADFQGLSNKVYLTIEGEKLNAQVSMPMEQIGLRMFHGRYLNGEASLSVALDRGLLRVNPTAISVKGKPLPDIYLEKLRKENLARGVNENSKASIALNRLQAIQIKDGRMIFLPKQEK